METKEVSFVKNGEILHRVIIEEETALARLRRSNLRLEAINAVGEDGDTKILHVVFYPDCIAAVNNWCGANRPTFEEFCKLPGQFVDDWAGVVWELIPAWKPQPPEDGQLDPLIAEVARLAHEADVKKP
jgi:hypothetical protein